MVSALLAETRGRKSKISNAALLCRIVPRQQQQRHLFNHFFTKVIYGFLRRKLRQEIIRGLKMPSGHFA